MYEKCIDPLNAILVQRDLIYLKYVVYLCLVPISMQFCGRFVKLYEMKSLFYKRPSPLIIVTRFFL